MSEPTAIDPRVRALRAYGLLDTPRTAEFDDLAILAKLICRTRFAVVNFVDAHRQWFKAEVGFGVRELPLDNSICARVMLEDSLIEIPDLTRDDRFACNPLITGDPGLRFYAGAPLVSPDGFVLGTLCVLDTEAMTLDGEQKEALSALGRQVVAQMELARERDTAWRQAVELREALAQRDRAEAVRRDQELEQRFVIDHALAGLVVHDETGGVAFCNRTACDMLGMTADQVTGRSPADPDWHFVGERGDVLSLAEYPVSIVMHSRQPLSDYVVGIVRTAGAETIWALVNAYPQLTPQGEVGRTVVSFVDISARKRAEDLLRDADRRKDEFLAMLAHELRNPLAPIGTSAQILKRSSHDAERVERTAAVVERQVAHLTTLVDDLLDVSRVTRGLVTIDRAPVDIHAVISGALEQVHPLLVERRHAVRAAFAGEAFLVEGDFHRLVQVVANLLANAAKYTPQGGEVDVQVSLDDDEVSIVVSDNGIGISPELLDDVFELFAQGERSPDRAQGGLGIGLALVRSLVALHGGSVGARSDGPHRGSAFTVRLPRARQTAIRSPGPPAVGGAVGAKRRILLVDDNRDAANTLGDLLTMMGHEVRIASDGASGIEAARADPADTYILDIGLPDMTGYQLAEILRAQQSGEGILLIALTGYGQAHDRVMSKAAGFDHHMVKPPDVDELIGLLERS